MGLLMYIFLQLKADLNNLQEKDKIAEARKTTVNESFLQTSAELQSNTALWNIINEVEKALGKNFCVIHFVCF